VRTLAVAPMAAVAGVPPGLFPAVPRAKFKRREQISGYSAN